MELTAPAVLLSTISLLSLAYTNRFLAITARVRDLHSKYKEQPDKQLLSQIKSLQKRIRITRDMQTLGVFSLFMFVLSMFLIFTEQQVYAKYVFGTGLIILMISLGLSTLEIYMSTTAINIQLSDLQKGIDDEG